jgi:putative endopeptidase
MRCSRLLCLAGTGALLLRPIPAAAQAPGDSTLPPLRVVDPRYIDSTASACTDFFQYANGAWLDHDTIPPEYSSSGVQREMTDRNQLTLRRLLDDLLRERNSRPNTSTDWKLGTFYGTCMDSSRAEREGLSPLGPLLRSVEAVRSRRDLVREIARLQREGVGILFDYGPDADPHDASHYLAWLSQGGLGLPDRDYYTREGPAADSLRRAYQEHIARYLVMAGSAPAAAGQAAARVLDLETQLARASLTRVERRDPEALDHSLALDSLRSLSPALDWSVYFRGIGLTTPIARVNVAEPAFFERASQLLQQRDLADWRAYLRYHLLASAAPLLASAWVAEDFAFSSRFTGATQPLPRWKRCLRRVDYQMGEAIGQAYVERSFSPQARARARTVIDDIRGAFGERLRHLTWMSDSTRAQALDKLARMGEKVGYPDRWRDYSALQVSEGPFVLNSFQADRFEWNRVVNRPGQPVDTTEWDITVPTVNAYYSPEKNEMVFPAGALVPQTFDPAADDGANYGSLGGSWAGHELTHGFDDEGRHYDAGGNLRDWWTPADSAHFSEQGARIVDQFDGYIQVDTFHVNGKLTEGENLADLGGVLTGYDALERALERDGRPGPIDGYTPEQRFFLAYAQSWRVHNRPERLRTRVTVDPHAPERWRVNGPLANSEAFARAFDCKAPDPMVRPRDLVPEIW